MITTILAGAVRFFLACFPSPNRAKYKMQVQYFGWYRLFNITINSPDPQYWWVSYMVMLEYQNINPIYFF